MLRKRIFSKATTFAVMVQALALPLATAFGVMLSAQEAGAVVACQRGKRVLLRATTCKARETQVLDLSAPQSTIGILGATNGANQTFGQGRKAITIESPNSTVFSFETTAAETDVAITFSAECSVKAPDNNTWLNLDIAVDGVVQAPTDGNNAFCTSLGTNQLNRWVTASVTLAVQGLAPGLHSIEVFGTMRGSEAGDEFWIGDTSLVVITN